MNTTTTRRTAAGRKSPANERSGLGGPIVALGGVRRFWGNLWRLMGGSSRSTGQRDQSETFTPSQRIHAMTTQEILESAYDVYELDRDDLLAMEALVQIPDEG
jgi:hypothetical protein